MVWKSCRGDTSKSTGTPCTQCIHKILSFGIFSLSHVSHLFSTAQCWGSAPPSQEKRAGNASVSWVFAAAAAHIPIAQPLSTIPVRMQFEDAACSKINVIPSLPPWVLPLLCDTSAPTLSPSPAVQESHTALPAGNHDI